MAVCKFYQQGICRFGNACRFEHREVGLNRYGDIEDALSRYSINIETIQKDLSTEAPQWILSAYAPGRNAPEQLFGGFPREQSFEEMRLHYLMAKASGTEQHALNQAQELYQNARQQMQTALSNIQDAARFVVEAENRHPNRLDICREGTQGAPFSSGPGTASPFGGSTAQPMTSAFGQPSALGQRPNPFGTSSFGQPSAQPQASSFGQTSQPAGSAFGQGPQTVSAFGQPSVLGARPNPFGTPVFGQTAQPASLVGGSPFQQEGGQLGGARPNPFASGGASAAANTTPAANPFASANQAVPHAAANAFGSNAFQQNGNTQQVNPFGSQQTQNQSTSPFGQASSQPLKANPFATANNPAPQQPSSNPFAQKTPDGANGTFGSNNTQAPFGQPPPQPQDNPFAARGQVQQQAPAPPAAGGATAPVGGTDPYPPGSSKRHPAIDSYATKNADGTLASFKGRPVTYKGDLPGVRAFNGSWTRIWFPAGPPGYYKDTELPLGEYDDRTKAQWAAFNQTGQFAGGVMPELPPPRECTLWDF
ncbi:hypothetical protein E4U42_002477 [Claviceps africana]|uniref:C3H1-type domain-containing protein n=1 Tax=Claviceps africana TaxID=83212 RepID=A0A8K0NJL0_9HYPO|nr:hypothetical protein E4U42_002477 [Claviceps africana]